MKMRKEEKMIGEIHIPKHSRKRDYPMPDAVS